MSFGGGCQCHANIVINYAKVVIRVEICKFYFEISTREMIRSCSQIRSEAGYPPKLS